MRCCWHALFGIDRQQPDRIDSKQALILTATVATEYDHRRRASRPAQVVGLPNSRDATGAVA
ncbi:MAG: hypothetical protein CMJ59_03440 [Planctomycetaceae bacterium]|nr:hypothetical protein [Planctomycetaceae bacterium]